MHRQLKASRNIRRAFNIAFFAGGLVIAVVLGFSTYDFPIRPIFLVAFLVAYNFTVPVVLGRWFGGVSNEQTYSFPYQLDLVFDTVPGVFQKNRWSLYGKIVETDRASGRYVVKCGWRNLGPIMTINLSKLDEKTTKVNVLSKTGRFFDYGSTRKVIEIFLNKLNTSLKMASHTYPVNASG